MKKILIALMFVSVMAVPSVGMAESSLMRAWNQWVLMRKAAFGAEIKATEQTTEVITEDTVVVDQEEESKDKKENLVLRTYSQPSYLRKSISSVTQSTKLRAQVRAIEPRTDVHKVTDEVITVFEIGVKLNSNVSSTKFSEAVLLDEARFKLFQNSGILEDAEDLELVVNGEAVSLEEDGTVTVQFHNARIAKGETLDVVVGMKIKDADITAHTSGQMMLRIESLTARGESSEKEMKAYLYGTPVSHRIVFDPIPFVEEGQDSMVALETNTTVYGRTLDEGEEAYVLVGRFAANYDDIYLREATLRNSLTGSDLDSLVDEISAVNLETGKVLDTARFTGGSARFKFLPDVFVGRGDDVKIGFKLEVNNPLRTSGLDSRFKLELAPADLVAQSASTGKILGSSSKLFSIDSEEFAISQGSLTLASSVSQRSFAVGTGSPETVYSFIVGGNDNALGRVAFDVYLSGMEFGGGALSEDDVALVRVSGGRDYDESVDVSVSGNTVILDFPNSYKIWDDVVEFGLQLKLDDLPGDSDSDLVSVRMLGDTSYQGGVLSEVRATGANFVWSDLSARAHSVSTSDWFSGYKVSGLPSNTTVIRRFER